MIDDIYNRDVLRLAANIGATDRLRSPDATVELTSQLCGSHITVDISSENGVVSAYAHDIKACALGQAAASVVGSTIVGVSLKELVQVRQTVKEMLTTGGPAPAGSWAALAALAPAKDAASRHGAILLPFDAAIAALEKSTTDNKIVAGA